MFYLLNIFLMGIIFLELTVKCRLILACSLKSLLMINPGFNIYPTWNWWISLFFFIYYHIFSHMPKIQRITCTQQIPQWNWFTIVPFSDVLIFTSWFFASILFVSNNKIFVNVKLMTLFWKCNIIICFISDFFLLGF